MLSPRTAVAAFAFVVVSACGGSTPCGDTRCACIPCSLETTEASTLPAPYAIDRAALDATVPGTYAISIPLDGDVEDLSFELTISPTVAPRRFAYLLPTQDAEACAANATIPGCISVALPYDVAITGPSLGVEIQTNPVADRPMFVDATSADGPSSYPSLGIMIERAVSGSTVPTSVVLEIRPDGSVHARFGERVLAPDAATPTFVRVGGKSI